MCVGGGGCLLKSQGISWIMPRLILIFAGHTSEIVGFVGVFVCVMLICYFSQNMVCLFVLRFYGPVNPMGSCRARSVYLTTRLLGRLSPLSG